MFTTFFFDYGIDLSKFYIIPAFLLLWCFCFVGSDDINHTSDQSPYINITSLNFKQVILVQTLMVNHVKYWDIKHNRLPFNHLEYTDISFF